jgi:class 3 adenylate cyclase
MSQHDQPSHIAVLLFTDMVDSVAWERRVGTEAYGRLLTLHHQLFRECLDTVGSGKIHWDSGDGFLAEFDTAAKAVKAALVFQALLREGKWETEPPRVRIGIHQGQLSQIQPDPNAPGRILGLPVSIAARIMGLAGGGQILMTRPVYDDARQFVREHPATRRAEGSLLALEWRSYGLYRLKGNDEPMDVFEVGVAGLAPLTAPTDSEKASRVSTSAPTPQVQPGGGAIGVGLAV